MKTISQDNEQQPALILTVRVPALPRLLHREQWGSSPMPITLFLVNIKGTRRKGHVCVPREPGDGPVASRKSKDLRATPCPALPKALGIGTNPPAP